jgi:hypothetical protein
MRSPSRPASVALLFLAALTLSGGPAAAQSPSAEPSLAAPSVPGASAAIADQRLADAVAATIATGTVRTAFEIAFDGSSAIPEGTTFSGHGQTAFGLERQMRLLMDMTAFELGKVEVIVDDQVVYARGLPFGDAVPADTWVVADLTSENPVAVSLRELASGNNDASLLLYYLLGATAPATDLGEETISGVPTTHMAATVDLDRALQLVPEEMRETLATNIADVRAGGVEPVLGAQAWIDADDLVHRVTFDYTLGEAMGGGTMTVTFDLSEHGLPLDLGIPAPDETISIDDLQTP